VLRDLPFFGQIADADHQSGDVVVAVADVAEGDRGREFSSILPAVHVLTGPQCLVVRNGWYRFPAGETRGSDHEIIH
jgi:hypothetical protein